MQPSFVALAISSSKSVVHVGVGCRARLDDFEGRPDASRRASEFGLTVSPSPEKCVFVRANHERQVTANPGSRTIGACVWVLMRPGMTTCPVASIVSAPFNRCATAFSRVDRDNLAAVSATACSQHPSAPFPSSPLPPVTTSETLAGSFQADRMADKPTHQSAHNDQAHEQREFWLLEGSGSKPWMKEPLESFIEELYSPLSCCMGWELNVTRFTEPTPMTYPRRRAIGSRPLTHHRPDKRPILTFRGLGRSPVPPRP